MIDMAKKKDNLVLQFIPYADIESLDSNERVEKLLDLVMANKIVLIEGKLKPTEEAMLIQRTMEEITRKFTGIEIATIQPKNESDALFAKLRKSLINFFLKYQTGVTIIGPANVVSEIKKNPDNIQLLMKG